MKISATQLALPETAARPNQAKQAKQAKTNRAEAHVISGRFLKGPIPLAWVFCAARLSGQSLHVAIVLWFLSGVKNNRTVTLSNKLLSEAGVDRYAKKRALHYLKQAGLISVLQQTGRSPVITILDGPSDG